MQALSWYSSVYSDEVYEYTFTSIAGVRTSQFGKRTPHEETRALLSPALAQFGPGNEVLTSHTVMS